jgi:hypothetical protein
MKLCYRLDRRVKAVRRLPVLDVNLIEPDAMKLRPLLKAFATRDRLNASTSSG